ncbi:two-component system sensor histidine kinase/response regulator, partial [gut metagenome]
MQNTCRQNRKDCKPHPSQLPTFPVKTSFTDIEVKENEIWIATNYGLYRYNRNENIVKHYSYEANNPHSLSQNFLTSLAITQDKQLIVASLKGINVYNPIQDNFYRIKKHNSNNGHNLLNSDFINCILVEGRHIWIGTESGGINKLTAKRQSIINYQHEPNNPNTLSPNPVNAIYEDKNANLWIGTVEGGLNRKSFQSDTFTHYTLENGTINHNSVSAITADKQDRLWVGTWGGGITLLNLNHPHRQLKVLFTETGAPYPIDFVGALTYDSINNGMWIGANQGLFFYDIQTDQLTAPLIGHASEKIRGCIGSIIDKDQQLWQGCLDGVYVIDLTSRNKTDGTFSYRHLKYKLDNPDTELIEKITCFHETEDGTLWLGSNGNGLYKRTVSKSGKESFINYSKANGLASNSIRSIQEDDKGNLWIATNKGLSRLIPSNNCFINYNQQDGLAHSHFYWNAACHSQNHTLYFGHMQGLSAIGNELPLPEVTPANIHFTRLLVGNEEVKSGSKWLNKDITVTQEITLHESSKSFAVEFSALNFETDHTAAYSYRLIGFDKDWIQLPTGRRFVSYTNLSAGKYILQVKYQSADESQKARNAELRITIRPYFYKTAWFILIILAILGISIQEIYQWRIRNYKKQRKMLHQEVEQRTYELNQQKQLLEQKTKELSQQNERLKEQNEKIKRQRTQLARMTRKVQELTLDKIAFFTNITHEFRTPITLIIGPIERALKLSYNPQVIEQLHFVERNSKYLLSLVNQLMDFRKVESGKLEIVKNSYNFRKFVNELIIPFSVFAKERNIELRSYYRLPYDIISYDEEAMHKVLTNLLSNAIKFTPNGGIVSLFIALLPATTQAQAKLYICVCDTGNGIPTDDIDKI